MCSYDAADAQVVTVYQEAGEECIFATESRNDQRSQAREERGKRSQRWGDHSADSPDAVRSVYSNHRFSSYAYTDDPVKVEYVGLYRAAAADLGDDASRTGTAGATAAETEGP